MDSSHSGAEEARGVWASADGEVPIVSGSRDDEEEARLSVRRGDFLAGPATFMIDSGALACHRNEQGKQGKRKYDRRRRQRQRQGTGLRQGT